MGGLAIPVLSVMAPGEFDTSKRVTEPLVNLIAPMERVQADVHEGRISRTVVQYQSVLEALSKSRGKTREEHLSRRKAFSELVKPIADKASQKQRLLLETADQKGVSSWLTADPMPQYGTVLNRSDFHDAVCLRYGFQLDGLPPTCVCGEGMTMDHAMTCPSGGYPIARHNEIRDVIAEVLREVVHDVEIEPKLLPYADEDLTGKTTNRSVEARLDIRARGFWTRQQEAFFDIRVTHSKDCLWSGSDVLCQLESNEREKTRQYAQRINTIDRGTFTPLVFSTGGMAGRECTTFLKSLVSLIVGRNIDLRYSQVMNRLRCKLSFCLVRWSITCLRGCRASYRRSSNHAFVSECRMVATP